MKKILKPGRKIALLTLSLISAGICAYGAGHYYIKNYGLSLKPAKDFKARPVAYYLQADPQWGRDRIGQTQSTMAGEGCLISCVASAAEAMGFRTTPKELNQKLAEAKAYAGDRLVWNKIGTAVPGLGYSYKRLFTSSTIEKDLADGKLPIVNVRFLGDGVTHWVLITGAKDGDFLIYDPANRQKEFLPLSIHGKVYAYRVLEKSH